MAGSGVQVVDRSSARMRSAEDAVGAVLAAAGVVLVLLLSVYAHATTTGVFRPTDGHIFLKNSNSSGFADVDIVFGSPGDKPVAGDWNGDGRDTIGIFRNGVFFLRNKADTYLDRERGSAFRA